MDILKDISQSDDVATLGNFLFQQLKFIGSIKGSALISAQFDPMGNKVHGSDKISITLTPGSTPTVWYFKVNDIENYTFVRFPLNPSPAEELCGQIAGEQNPRAEYWRWIQRARAGTIVGGNVDPPNILVPFIVVGYKPAALLKEFTESPVKKDSPR